MGSVADALANSSSTPRPASPVNEALLAQARAMNANLWHFNPIEAALGLLGPGRTLPHIANRNAMYGPQDTIPTIAGGRANAPFGSADIADNALGMVRPGGYGEQIPGKMPSPANENALGVVSTKGPSGGMTVSGRPSQPSYHEVVGLLDRLGIPRDAWSIQQAGTGTRYIRVNDAGGGQPVTIRVPSDGHGGNPARINAGSAPGNFFETSADRMSPGTARFGRAVNEGGERFSDLGALEAALRWRFPNYVSQTGQNFLVRPDQAPSGANRPPMVEVSPPPPQGADFSPNQPRLLAAGVPAALAALDWSPTVTPEGQPSQPPAAAGDLVGQSRVLRALMSGATEGINRDFFPAGRFANPAMSRYAQ